MPTLTDQVLQTAQMLVAAREAGEPFYAFTGAGISTGSGLPDFRSPQGLWNDKEAMSASTVAGFCENPDTVWQLYVDGFDAATPVPNAGHRALAELETSGLISAIVTQNVDALHQEAGSKVVHHLHGDLSHAFCLDCERRWPMEEARQYRRSTGKVMECPDCETPLQPSLVLFDQMLPTQPWDAAAAIAQSAGGVLVAGSSLAVAPAHFIPLMTVDRPRPWVLVNYGPTEMDHMVGAGDVRIEGDCSTILPAVVQLCKVLLGSDE